MSDGPTLQRFELSNIELITPKIVRRPLFLSFGVTLVVIITAGAYYLVAQPILPFFYTLPREDLSLAPKSWLFVFPTISFAMSITHVLLAHFLRKLDSVLLSLFIGTGLVLQLILLATLIRLIGITW